MIFRKIEEKDRKEIFDMMSVFYRSDAVSTNGSPEIFNNNISACLDDNINLYGYVFSEDGEIAGYGMVTKSFSTEAGKECFWVEDLYIKPEYRGKGTGGQFLDFLRDKYKGYALKLEVEAENERAIAVYKKHGFSELPYFVMAAF